tara:strand:- start:702 stop:1469 length:768 start_codon:yes stop_codon:yes gene_type:complete
MKNIKLTTIDNTLLVTIDRPEKLNALNSEVIDELSSVFINHRDDSNVKAIILTGQGDKSFIAGADIKEMSSFTPSEASIYSNKGIDLFNNIESYSKPVVAAINGYALGGGLELALACHIRYVSGSAVLGLPEVSLGLIPGFGGTQRLRNIVGLGLAIEIITSARHVKSNEALRIGLANKICDNVVDDSIDLCKKIGSNSSASVKAALQSIVSGKNTNYYDSFNIENNLFSQLFDSHDTKEGIDAFLNKRKPKFKD